MIQRGSASFLGFGFLEAFKPPEHADGMLAVISTGGTEFIEDDGFFFSRNFLLTEKDCFDEFPF